MVCIGANRVRGDEAPRKGSQRREVVVDAVAVAMVDEVPAGLRVAQRDVALGAGRDRVQRLGELVQVQLGEREAALCERHRVPRGVGHRDVVAGLADPARGVGLHLVDPQAASVLLGVFGPVVLELVDRDALDVAVDAPCCVRVQSLGTDDGIAYVAELTQAGLSRELRREVGLADGAVVEPGLELGGVGLGVAELLDELVHRDALGLDRLPRRCLSAPEDCCQKPHGRG
ncbi:MAG: hypothetical protein GY913_09215 [Proteobacteria bacterium]|nr:hypothetical protein [Pseudomonadota bacterium]MCP4917091.1 hypothetical protein [Pseudomonadota bacterium]